MKTLITFLALSLVANAICITILYNREEWNQLRFKQEKIKYEENLQEIKKQLATYDDAALSSTFNKLFPDSSNIDCTTGTTYSRELLQDTTKQNTK